MAGNKTGFTLKHLTRDLISDILSGVDKSAILDSWSLHTLDSSNGYINGITTKENNQKMVGFQLLRIVFHHENEDTESRQKIVVLKSKIPGYVICQNLSNFMSDVISKELIEANRKLFVKLGMMNMHMKELMFVRLQDPVMKQVMPDIFWSMVDEDQDVYIFAMEYFDQEHFTMVDCVPKGVRWQEADMIDAVRTLAVFHSRFYDRTDEIPTELKKHLFTLNKIKATENIDVAKSALLETHEFPQSNIWTDDISKENFKVLLNACDVIDKIGDVIETAALTLTHGDCQIRNICLRNEPREGKLRVCFYDWDFISIAPPQMDLALMLSLFFIDRERSIAEYHDTIEVYITCLKQHLSTEKLEDTRLDLGEFIKVFDMCFIYAHIHHLGILMAINSIKADFGYLMDCVKEGHRYISRIKDKYEFLR